MVTQKNRSRELRYIFLFLLINNQVFSLINKGPIIPIADPKIAPYFAQNDPKTYLLSYPRSGNTWMRYCIEFLTKRPTIWFETEFDGITLENIPLGYSFDLGTDFSKLPIWKVHNPDVLLCNLEDTEQMLIVLVRNYKEAIARHMGGALNVAKINTQQNRWYFEALQLYEAWNPKKRLLLYYEDLITNPRKVFTELINFLHEELSLLDEFMANYDRHKKDSIAYYSFHSSPSVTQGNHVIAHSLKTSKAERIRIDSFVKARYPIIWEKYLKRYQEK